MAAWTFVGVVVAGATLLTQSLGVRPAALFGGLIGGLVCAGGRVGRRTVPGWLPGIGQAVVGATIGSHIDEESIWSFAGNWLPVTTISMSTIVVRQLLHRPRAMQYLRVIVILASLPIVVGLVAPPAGPAVQDGVGPSGDPWLDYAFVGLCLSGVALSR